MRIPITGRADPFTIGVDTMTMRKQIGPRFGIIEPLTACQLRCPGCYMIRRKALNGRQMSLEEAIRILDLCRDHRGGVELETMDILGGEPLFWPSLEPFVEELLRRQIKPWIFTNMIAITPELAKWLFDRKVAITGKLNIGNPEDPSQMKLQAEMIGRDVETARQMIRSIDVFLGVGYRDPLFRLENLLRRKNLPFAADFVVYCRSRGIGFDLEVMGCGEPLGEDYFRIAPTPAELAALVREFEKRPEDLPEFRGTEGKLLMPHMFGACRFFDNGMYFAVDGGIRACSNSMVELARVTDPDPIRKADESRLICSRKSLTQAIVGEPCRSCSKWTKCRGGCRATAEGSGDPFAGFQLCPLPILHGNSE